MSPPTVSFKWTDVLYGLVNGILVVPVSISFANIIFRDAFFQAEMMPSLVKLVLFSSAIHQLCFSCLSTLPFAIGQVQDAGLIFLSAMASSVVASLALEKESILPTTLFTLAASTVLLGLALVLLGRLKLASLVQYIPMPVIGGYLAFIGFFCGEAALAMMAGVSISSKSDWLLLFTFDKLSLISPGVLCGIAMFVLLPLIKNPLFLPLFLVLMVMVFYIVLAISGSSIQDARDSGWVAPLTAAQPWYQVWDGFNPSKVVFSAFPGQLGRLVAMIVVVGFSSTLDIAAIEMESPKPVDFNRELQTVGWSNVISGATGGFTGSYIFSQTLFCLRRGITSRVCGVIVALVELFVFFLPVSITSFVPKLIFGALLVFIAVDLMSEWLVDGKNKMTRVEYLVCVGTFLSMVVLGVQLGLFVGIILAMAVFIYSYSSSPVPTVSITAHQQSRVARSFKDRCFLLENAGRILRLKPHGYVFFGTALRLLEEVRRHIMVRHNIDSPTMTGSETDTISNNGVTGISRRSGRGRASYQAINDVESGLNSLDNEKFVEFVVIDFSAVVGVDVTAARSCFLSLTRLLTSAGVSIIYAELNQQVEVILKAQKVINDESIIIPALDDALEWCEECILLDRFEENRRQFNKKFFQNIHKNRDVRSLDTYNHDVKTPQLRKDLELTSTNNPILSSSSINNNNETGNNRNENEFQESFEYTEPLCRIFKEYLEPAGSSINSGKELPTINEPREDLINEFKHEILIKYFKRVTIPKQCVLFKSGTKPRKLFIIEKGIVEIVMDRSAAIERVRKLSSGSMVGEAEFLLNQTYSMTCVTVEETRVWTLDKNALKRMKINNLSLYSVFEEVMLFSLSSERMSNYNMLFPSNIYKIDMTA